MKKSAITIFLLLFILSGCSSGKKMSSTGIVSGKDTVAILYKESKFKDAVLEKVETYLKEKKIRFVADNVKNSKKYKASDYLAVIYMAEFWAWHTPAHTKRYFSRNDNASNIIFLITSGNPDVRIKKPFDAVTSASKQSGVEKVSSEIIRRIESF